ncbi:site-specific tyrosine recombinase XerD [Microlunatus elymi]|uniref:Tyrosine recombinase XerC n=1 Tax=Microlunatus elymi TaxID=2596828 RepID=A0A516Q1H8_9ACTN|nr:site-specific tyrosine recombinase XerD [Microlunatus elymi]QDP97289.1 site-specific tyrosine recombinase XerD [Microlunatus elymi]
MDKITRLINSYLDHLVVERGLSAHTVSGYRRDLGRYAAFLRDHGVDDPTKINSTMITGYAASLAEGVPDKPAEGVPDGAGAAAGEQTVWRYPPLATSSTARALAAVRGLHKFAAEEGVVADNPASEIRPPKPARRLPKALPLDAVQALLAAPGCKTPLALRDTALLELLYGTGGRISEIVGLDVDELSGLLTEPDEVGGLRVIGKGNKERFVPLGRYAKKAVTDYLVRGRPDLARRGRGTAALLLNARGGRLSRQGAWLIIQQAAERAKINIEISPHTLRHSFATHLLDGGADVRVVQELLGHASVTTTQIYTLVTVDHLREVYATSHPRAR